MWVILNSNGMYVSKGGATSFTKSLEKAKIFKTEEDAKNDCCGNERPVAVSSILN